MITGCKHSEIEGNCGVWEQNSHILSTCNFVPRTKDSGKSETVSQSNGKVDVKPKTEFTR